MVTVQSHADVHVDTDIEFTQMDVFIWTSIWREATSRETLAFCVMGSEQLRFLWFIFCREQTVCGYLFKRQSRYSIWSSMNRIAALRFAVRSSQARHGGSSLWNGPEAAAPMPRQRKTLRQSGGRRLSESETAGRETAKEEAA